MFARFVRKSPTPDSLSAELTDMKRERLLVPANGKTDLSPTSPIISPSLEKPPLDGAINSPIEQTRKCII